jgi:hypothetical protein
LSLGRIAMLIRMTCDDAHARLPVSLDAQLSDGRKPLLGKGILNS